MFGLVDFGRAMIGRPEQEAIDAIREAGGRAFVRTRDGVAVENATQAEDPDGDGNATIWLTVGGGLVEAVELA